MLGTKGHSEPVKTHSDHLVNITHQTVTRLFNTNHEATTWVAEVKARIGEEAAEKYNWRWKSVPATIGGEETTLWEVEQTHDSERPRNATLDDVYDILHKVSESLATIAKDSNRPHSIDVFAR